MNMDVSAVGTGQGPLPERFAEPSPVRQESRASAGPGGNAGTDAGNYLGDLERISLIYDKKLQFMFDKKYGDVVVKVIDGKTDKVIREIPPKELQDLHIKIRETIGILFDEKA